MKKQLQNTINLNVFGAKIKIEAPKKIVKHIKHDYFKYVSDKKFEKIDFKFILIKKNPKKINFPNLIATKYHDDYIVYEKKDIRVIDYFGKTRIFYDIPNRIIKIYSNSENLIYDAFYTAFEANLGDLLDKKGFHRIHCLALEKDEKATLLLLPPGAGKTTLALKFLKNKEINVLSEDIVLFKNKKLHGLHFRWGTREKTKHKSRILKREKHHQKYLINTKHLNLSNIAKPKNIIMGQRSLSNKPYIKKMAKSKLILPLFKSMVLGLELQQSLAYFLLRNYKDAFSKINIGISRLNSLRNIISKSKTYRFIIGQDINKNYNLLCNLINNHNSDK